MSRADDTALLVTLGVRAPVAARILADVGPSGLVAITPAVLESAGVPRVTTARVLASLSLARRCAEPAAPLAVLGRAEDVARILAPRVSPDQECFYVLPINIRNGLIGGDEGVIEVARGSVAGVEVHPRDVFRPAIRASAAGVVLAHNHPSGDPEPSTEDLMLTTRLRECGKLLGIPVIDHVIVTTGVRFYSMAESQVGGF